MLLIAGAVRSYAATYDWVGTTLTGGVYDWNNKLNWQVGGAAATAVPGATDIVQIGVSAYTNAPTITDARSCASLKLGVYDNFTLTVNGSLSVTGDITQTNDPNFYQYTTLTGTGTISCNNFVIGDNTTPGSGIGVVINIISQVKQITINGNLVLNSAGNSTGDGIAYPYFSLDANKLTLYGQIVTSKYSNPLIEGVGDPMYPGYGLFQMDSDAGATTLELLNAAPISTPITSGFTVDFTNNGAGAGTVIYDAPSGNQAVYTTGTTGIGINNFNYDYLTFAGGSKKVLTGGAITIGADWTTGGTGAVDLNTNNPSITVSGNWVNSTNVTQGSGDITLSNILQNNNNTITLGSGKLSVGNILQINFGTIKGGSGAVTVTGIFQNNSGALQCGSGNITFKSNYTNSSTFTAGAGTVYFSGASPTLLDNGPTGTMFNNVTFNGTGTATMSAGVGNFAVSGTGVLSLVSPEKLIAGSATVAYLTLKSTSAGSATVSGLSGGSAITGQVSAERYITGGSSTYRGYRLLTSTVYNATVGGLNVYNFDYIKAGVLLTGPAGGGFDKTGNPSLYLYRENQAFSNTAFTSGNNSEVNKINNSPSYNIYTDGGTTNYNVSTGNGFLLFFRGDRTTNLANKYTPGTSAESVTLKNTGLLNQGQITVRDWYTPASANLGYTVTAGNATVRGYNLVGNPYPSSIDWDLYNTSSATSGIYASNIGTSIYVLDPVSKNYGVYTQGGGVGTHNTSNILPSGQGFFVVASNASATLTFNESAKSNTQVSGINLLLGKPPVDYTNLQYLRLMLAKDSVNTDDIVIRFSNMATTAYSKELDALYRQGSGMVSLSSLSSDNVPLAINVRPLPTRTTGVIDLAADATGSGTYQFRLRDIVGVPRLFDIWLKDKLKNVTVDMRKDSIYSFDIAKNDSSTFGAKRFAIIIGQNPDYAYRLLNFTAAQATPAANVERQVQAVWKTENEGNYTSFTVERSTDNCKSFDVVGSLWATGQGTYSFADKNPAVGQNFYRLKQIDINDSISYSRLVPIEFTVLSKKLINSNINVYPNPASSVINLTVASGYNTNGASFNIRITNSVGILIKSVTSSQPAWHGSVSDLINGTYMIRVINSKDQTLIGQTKFVKL